MIDQVVLAEAYDHERARLLRTCRRMLGNPAEAEDAVHEVFTRVARRLEAGADLQDLPAYLTTVARSVCVDAIRRRQPAAELADARDRGEDVESRAIRRTAVMQLLTSLTRRERSLLLGTAAGLSYAELAGRSGESPAAVARALVRARARARGLAGRFGSLPALAGHVSTATSLAGARLMRRWLTPETATLRGGAARVATVAALATVLSSGGPGGGGSDPGNARGADGARVPVAMAPVGPSLPGAAAIVGGAPNGVPGALRHAAPPAASVHAPAPSAPALPPPPSLPDATVTTVSSGPGPQGAPAVYATGVTYGCTQPVDGSCPVAYRSDDAGHTWKQLGGAGFGGGALTAVNGGTTLLAAAPDGLERSDDAGATFRTVLDVTGPIAADPGSPAGDARVLVAAAVPVVYDTAGRNASAGPSLPAGTAAPHSLVFTGPGRAVMELSDSAGDSVFALCSLTSCRAVMTADSAAAYSLSAVGPLVVAYHDGTVEYGMMNGGGTGPSLYVSRDGGQSFAPAAGDPGSTYLATVTPDGGGTILAAWWASTGPTSALGSSADAGSTFATAVGPANTSLSRLLGLGGGRVIAVATVPMLSGTLRCSADGGLHWGAC